MKGLFLLSCRSDFGTKPPSEMGRNVKIGKSGQRLGNFSCVGKGLAKIWVVASLYMSTTYENENFRWDFHTAEVTGSNPVPPNLVSLENKAFESFICGTLRDCYNPSASKFEADLSKITL